ncbi:putative peptide hydrolase [Kluyveromyces lactis]|uniref:KLLA0B12441p n=1 Tax=Kluyveromyces lactis (strain ATCC 8585 / CBS 2359 / DSM 70799 / NBRC 1267 / NRRL Y-1140 / WM37) TaxID=284590 RepID=Q6CVF5_KLULA|nr:uncharacterized protein KLLA0_B12441g [Kluyveromyces lactis]CAH02477.1 KLLA0B12441p [Kluyveromyces lactis]|eukprot:XP_452084.1 uncharacterized protein KLLA0_B12441g [Kluyveromyces lactis]
MCGRFAVDFDPETVRQEFTDRGVDLSKDKSSVPDFSRNYNVGPTQPARVYHDSRLQTMKWGLIPFWTKDLKKATPWRTFNARIETLSESRFWKPSLNHHRCIVPISGYYEWITVKGQKIPYFIRRRDHKVMFLAGLFDVLKHDKEEDNGQNGQEEGHEREKEELWTFTIITGPAPENLTWLHERMPIILEPNTKEWDTWFDPQKDSWTQKEVDEGLHTFYNEKEYECYKVPQEVGKVQNNGKHLMEPIKEKGKIHSFFKPKSEGSASTSLKEESEFEETDEGDTAEIKREHSDTRPPSNDNESDDPPAKRVKRERS